MKFISTKRNVNLDYLEEWFGMIPTLWFFYLFSFSIWLIWWNYFTQYLYLERKSEILSQKPYFFYKIFSQ